MNTDLKSKKTLKKEKEKLHFCFCTVSFGYIDIFHNFKTKSYKKANPKELKIRNITGMSTLTTVVQHSPRNPSLSNQTTKTNKMHSNWQKGQAIPLRRSHDTVHRKPKRLHPKIARTHIAVQQCSRIQNQCPEISGISIH